MTSEEIIQRLLDEKKISVKEAMIILKDLAKIGLYEVRKWLPVYIPMPEPKIEPGKKSPYDNVVVMYGVTPDNNWYTISNENTSFTSTTITNTEKTDDEKTK